MDCNYLRARDERVHCQPVPYRSVFPQTTWHTGSTCRSHATVVDEHAWTSQGLPRRLEAARGILCVNSFLRRGTIRNALAKKGITSNSDDNSEGGKVFAKKERMIRQESAATADPAVRSTARDFARPYSSRSSLGLHDAAFVTLATIPNAGDDKFSLNKATHMIGKHYFQMAS